MNNWLKKKKCRKIHGTNRFYRKNYTKNNYFILLCYFELKFKLSLEIVESYDIECAQLSFRKHISKVSDLFNVSAHR